MSPTQYRALERLLDAARGGRPHPGLLVATGTHVPPGRIHPRTANALVRRGLAERRPVYRGEELAVITQAGIDLLARRPDPIDATR